MFRKLILTIIFLGAVVAAQGKPSQPRFAAVSIKVEPPGYRSIPEPLGPVRPGGRYLNPQAILWSLMLFTFPQYTFPNKTVVGLPDWAYGRPGSLFDIAAIPKSGTAPDVPEMRQMMGAVLADRFHLRYHVENHSMPVLLLELSHGGVHDIRPSAPGQQSLKLILGESITGRGATMDQLAAKVGAFYEDRPVLNRTGLNGFYDIDVPTLAGGPYMGSNGRKTMILRQLTILGLKLVPTKATVPVMVVDHVERPTPN